MPGEYGCHTKCGNRIYVLIIFSVRFLRVCSFSEDGHYQSLDECERADQYSPHAFFRLIVPG